MALLETTGLRGREEPAPPREALALRARVAHDRGVASAGGHRETTASVRRFFYAAAVLVFAAGLTLFAGSGHTASYFAWTVSSPLTAAFLGANYVAVPPVMVVLGVRQLRAPGIDPPRSQRFPRPFAWAVAAEAIVLGGLGTALLAVPGRAAAVWPWPLTPLTARAIGAWLLGIGLGAALAGWEDDFERTRIVFVALGVAGLLQFVALGRYGDELGWPSATAVVYVAVLICVLVISAWGAAPRRSRRLR